jgi:REP element-mobilizing transposase RayT
MNRGASRQSIFLDDVDKRQFLDLLQECHDRWGAQVCCYCLMENHYHIFLSTPRGNLAQILRHLDGLYTQRFNKKNGRDGPLMRGRYKSILVDQDAYGLQVARYIHLNPLKAKIVSRPEDYAWSSYRHFFQEAGPAFLQRSLLLGFFGDGEGALDEFQRFTNAGIEEETEKFYSSKKLSPILAGASFLSWIRSRGFAGPRRNQVRLPGNMNADLHSSETIAKIVAEAYEVPLAQVMVPYRGRSHELHEARSAAIYLARELSGRKMQEIADAFGCGCQAAGKAASRFERRLLQKPDLRARVEEIRNILATRTLEHVDVGT